MKIDITPFYGGTQYLSRVAKYISTFFKYLPAWDQNCLVT